MLRVPNRANARIGRKGQPLFSTLLSSVASFANTITITGEPDAGTLTSATVGDTYSELLALINEGTATTDGPGGVTITPTLTGSSSDPVALDDTITGFSVVYTATDAAPVVRTVTIDPVITVAAVSTWVFTDNGDGTVTFTSAGTTPTPTFNNNANGTVTRNT